MQRLFFLIIILFAVEGSCYAQFQALQKLPWYPTSSCNSSIATTTKPVASEVVTTNVLDELSAALRSNRYSEVADELYPRAIREGYQRNAALYNNARRALRQLMREDATDNSWKKMQQLYADRFTNIGKDAYQYINNLEGNTWSEEQLTNEYVYALTTNPNRVNECYDATLKLVKEAKGRVDMAIILQGMFAPLNRASVANSDITRQLSEPYGEIKNWLDASEQFMEREHSNDYIANYPQATLAQVRNECNRVIALNINTQRKEEQQKKEELDEEYAAARALFTKGQYTEAYNACNEALRRHPSPDLRALKSTILQTCGTKASNAQDRVAFYIAAYEAGRGGASQAVLNGILEAIRANLFMSGIAGTTHTTRRPMIIRQRIWTIEELKEKSN